MSEMQLRTCGPQKQEEAEARASRRRARGHKGNGRRPCDQADADRNEAQRRRDHQRRRRRAHPPRGVQGQKTARDERHRDGDQTERVIEDVVQIEGGRARGPGAATASVTQARAQPSANR